MPNPLLFYGCYYYQILTLRSKIKEIENQVANHLSRLEQTIEVDELKINEVCSDEHYGSMDDIK